MFLFSTSLSKLPLETTIKNYRQLLKTKGQRQNTFTYQQQSATLVPAKINKSLSHFESDLLLLSTSSDKNIVPSKTEKINNSCFTKSFSIT